jgi:hypothetical protein
MTGIKNKEDVTHNKIHEVTQIVSIPGKRSSGKRAVGEEPLCNLYMWKKGRYKCDTFPCSLDTRDGSYGVGVLSYLYVVSYLSRI